MNAAELRPAIPSVDDRQSKQIFMAPHQFYNYHQPYQYQMLLPTAAGEIDSGNKKNHNGFIEAIIISKHFSTDVSL